MKKVFIDGKAGTTGLRIYERLEARQDIQILTLSEEQRKDEQCRKQMLNAADIVFLCLPDDAARQAVSMIENPDTVVIDTSTAHRTHSDWAYGFPELSPKYERAIKNSKRIAVPGCHASGFIALIKPLIDNGVLAKSEKLTCHSITGYSGGGKKMIAQYDNENRETFLEIPRQYALSQQHKHLPEMKKVCELDFSPIFCPIVSDFYSGMIVTVPVFATDLLCDGGIDKIKDIYRSLYCGNIVTYNEAVDADGMLSASDLQGTDSMEIAVFGNEDRILLTARYDNLGKGASGAAIEALNIVLGQQREKSLVLKEK